jgi:hypothetical protein
VDDLWNRVGEAAPPSRATTLAKFNGGLSKGKLQLQSVQATAVKRKKFVPGVRAIKEHDACTLGNVYTVIDACSKHHWCIALVISSSR